MTPAAWHALAYSLAAAALLLPLLLRDRAKGRPRCHKCWYSMQGIAALQGAFTCPECGAAHANERALLKPRTFRVSRTLALLTLTAAYPLWCIPRFQAEGRQGWIPTTLLVLTVPALSIDELPPWRKRLNYLTFDRLELRDGWQGEPDTRAWSWQQWLAIARLKVARIELPGHATSELRTYDITPHLRGGYDRESIGHCGLSWMFQDESPRLHWSDNRQSITDAITLLVRAEDWMVNGGTDASIHLLGTRLIIVTSPDHHSQIHQFLDLLSAPITAKHPAPVAPTPKHAVTPACVLAVHDLQDFVDFEQAPYPDDPMTYSHREDLLREIIDVITSCIDTDRWTANGGDVSQFAFVGSKLVISAPPRVQAQVHNFLATLRSAHVTPPRLHLKNSWAHHPRAVTTP